MGLLLGPLAAFVVTICVLVALVSKGLNIAISLTIATLLFGLLAMRPSEAASHAIRGLTSLATAKLVATFVLAFYLSKLMGEVGVLDKITRGIAGLSERFAAISVPSIIGLIPMPGGALVSAMMLRDLYMERLGLKRETATFLNYWFRHIWISVWPMHQTLIMTAYVLGLSVWKVIANLYPACAVAIAGGLPLAVATLRLHGGSRSCGFRIQDVREGLWPFALMAILVIFFRLDIITALLIAAAAVALAYRPPRSAHASALRFAFSPRILSAVIVVMVFRELILASGAPRELYTFVSAAGIPEPLVLFLVPLAVGLALASEYVVVAISFPLLLDMIMPGGVLDHRPLFLAFLGGYLRLYLFPAHLCLVLTIEYFRSKAAGVYKWIATASAIMAALGWCYALLC